ncbi:endonuclease domain-containing protein [Tolypothrix sp. FACHB-123]|uniref:endonuclease domain-containing protein n=1 Tax=Tolypothrix sp. FACHB-123 TaxID=2692868 RepID=UPI001F54A708|nr:DUF559 domain-containing protein [Tolypothrix sp. FACHB-123]
MRKTVQTMDGAVFVAGKSKECTNSSCTHFGKHYYATGVLKYSLPYSTYGLDVLAFIGWQHEHELGNNQLKERVEIDFLVFYKQKCMILEVDGEHHQQASQKTRDYRRDRVLLRDGIRTVRFNASECYNHPLEVVTEFLNLF